MKGIKPIHPFAARMAPEIAFRALKDVEPGSRILDPMVGSGTVLRTVIEAGYQAVGFDIDPLSVLMSRVWNTPLSPKKLEIFINDFYKQAVHSRVKECHCPWIDDDNETAEFVRFWFAKRQANDLRRLSSLLDQRKGVYNDAMKVVLSRLIITKSKGASLAADVAHSRPHKVRVSNDFDVLTEFKKSGCRLARLFSEYPIKAKACVYLGDSRRLKKLEDDSVHAIITSPPYLNALDYMRGHKLALVWLGYTISQLGKIRTKGVGVERIPDAGADLELARVLTDNLFDAEALGMRRTKMVKRYALDMYYTFLEACRVLKHGAKATFVIGNSCLSGVFIDNSEITIRCASLLNLSLTSREEREIPENRRYLPPPNHLESSVMKNRMRTEVILSFKK